MKATHRSIPNDILSVEEGDRKITIHTHRQELVAIVWKNDAPVRQTEFTFDQFYSALRDFLRPEPLSPPSEPAKEATAPAGDANQADIKIGSHAVGDLVELEDGRRGRIISIDRDEVADVVGEGFSCYREIGALKNLSR